MLTYSLLAFGLLACGDDTGSIGDGGVSDGGTSLDGALARDANTRDGAATDGAALDANTDVDAPIECTEPDTQSVTGRPMCHTVVEGIEFDFVPLAEGTPVERLAFYFHGDGGGSSRLGSLYRQADWGAEHNTVVIAAVSPVRDEDRPDIDFNNLVGARWWLVEPAHVQQLGRAMDRFVRHYDVDPHGLLFQSASGGSQFVNRYLIPHLGHRFSGVYAIQCGGSRPPHPYTWLWIPEEHPSVRDGLRMRFQYGSEDFLADQIERGLPGWRDLGFNVDTEVAEGAGHCGGDRIGHILASWSDFIGVPFEREERK